MICSLQGFIECDKAFFVLTDFIFYRVLFCDCGGRLWSILSSGLLVRQTPFSCESRPECTIRCWLAIRPSGSVTHCRKSTSTFTITAARHSEQPLNGVKRAESATTIQQVQNSIFGCLLTFLLCSIARLPTQPWTTAFTYLAQPLNDSHDCPLNDSQDRCSTTHRTVCSLTHRTAAQWLIGPSAHWLTGPLLNDS